MDGITFSPYKNTFPIHHHLFLFTTKCLNVLLLSERRYKQICHKIFIMTHEVVLTSISIEIRKDECTAFFKLTVREEVSNNCKNSYASTQFLCMKFIMARDMSA